MKKFCIVLPVYKETLDCVEEISLKRLHSVIGEKGYVLSRDSEIYIDTKKSIC